LACCTVLWACHDSTGPTHSDGCSGPVNVSVVRLAVPIFGWSGDCAISVLSVTTVAAAPGEARAVWGFTVPEREPQVSGVVYGKAPKRATTWHAPEDLERGRTYQVSVMYLVGGDVLSGGGSTNCTW
jgi:hypothetical protein